MRGSGSFHKWSLNEKNYLIPFQNLGDGQVGVKESTSLHLKSLEILEGRL